MELKLRVRSTQTIDCSHRSSVFAASDDFEISVYESEDMKKEALKRSDSLRKENQLKTYNDAERIAISNLISGSIFKASLDNTNPLGYGYGRYYYTLDTMLA